MAGDADQVLPSVLGSASLGHYDPDPEATKAAAADKRPVAEIIDSIEGNLDRMEKAVARRRKPTKAQEELAEYRALFEMQWRRDMEVIERWRAEGKVPPLTWPDHGVMVDGLLREISELRLGLRRFYDAAVRHLPIDGHEHDAAQAALDLLGLLDRRESPFAESTYACQKCGRADRLDAVLPNDMWAAITGGRLMPSGEVVDGRWQILCLWCIDTLVAEMYGTEHEADEWPTVELHFAGRGLISK